MPREIYRGKYRVFVGNTQGIVVINIHWLIEACKRQFLGFISPRGKDIASKDLEQKFSEFGKVIECDLKGAYGFVG